MRTRQGPPSPFDVELEAQEAAVVGDLLVLVACDGQAIDPRRVSFDGNELHGDARVVRGRRCRNSQYQADSKKTGVSHAAYSNPPAPISSPAASRIGTRRCAGKISLGRRISLPQS